MQANQKFRLGYMDARAAMSLANKMPSQGNMNALFRIKGPDYKAGFLKGLKSVAKKQGAEA